MTTQLTPERAALPLLSDYDLACMVLVVEPWMNLGTAPRAFLLQQVERAVQDDRATLTSMMVRRLDVPLTTRIASGLVRI